MLTNTHRARISAGVARAHNRAQREAFREPDRGFSESVARSTFGGGLADLGQRVYRQAEASIDGVHFTFDSRKVLRSDTSRAVVSHVKGQAAGLRTFLGRPDGAPAQHLVASMAFDDASMWVQRPASTPEPAAAGDPAILKKRGPNVFMAVLNKAENLFLFPVAASDGHPELNAAGAPFVPAGAEVASPAVCLPRANWATVYDRLRSWSVVCGGPSGAMVDPGRELQEALQQNQERVLLFCRDSLGVNLCVQGRLEALAGEMQDTPDAFSIFGQACVAHQIVLAMKPSLEHVTALTSNIVRLGHLFQGHRTRLGPRVIKHRGFITVS